jgi:predicted nucleic acid-binding protein
VAYLVDTNVLVYRHDPRFPDKQAVATRMLRDGLTSGEARLPHQALVEFVPAVTRPQPPTGASLMALADALREVERLLWEFPVLYPVNELVRLAVRGTATYQLNWFDAQIWAYAEFFAIPEIRSEDFRHGAVYGCVRVVNPFL